MSRTVPLLCVAFLILTAGCVTGGLSGDDASTSDPTAATTATAGDETTSEDGELNESANVSYPPGVTESGLENVTALVHAHDEALRNETYRATVELTARGDDIDERSVPFEVINGPNASLSVMQVSVNDGPIETYSVWERGEFVVSNNTGPEGTEYRYSQGGVRARDIDGSASGALFLRTYLTYGDLETDGTVTRDGRTLVRLVASDYNETAFEPTENGTVTAFEMTALVDERGVVHSMRIRSEAETENDTGETITVETNLTFVTQAIGQTSDPDPDWLDDVPQVRATLTADGEAIAVEHTGGTTLEAGTEFTVYDSSSARSRVTLPSDVAPGETVYFALDESGSSYEARVGVNEPPAVQNPVEFSGFARVGTVGDSRIDITLQVETDN